MKVLLTTLSLSLLVAAAVSSAATEAQSQPEVVSATDAALLSDGSEVSYFMLRGESHVESKYNMADGKEIGYVSSVEVKMVGDKKVKTLRRGSLFIGTRVESQRDGTCLKTVTKLLQMKTVEFEGDAIQVPDFTQATSSVACPA
jgi:hypothetical protein